MGGVLSGLASWIWGKREYRILIVGLDGAGKTTILNRLSLPDLAKPLPTIPTIGFNVEEVTIKNVRFQGKQYHIDVFEFTQVSSVVWDLGGQTSIRPYWKCYYANTDGIVFVVDSADIDRLALVHTELAAMLQEDQLNGVPLLIFANKQDLRDEAAKAADFEKQVRICDIKDRLVHVEYTTATSGEGLSPGFEWLVDAVQGKVSQ